MTTLTPAHSPIGASSCERWMRCPGSVQLARQAPQEPSSIYAATGTAAHELAAKYLAKGEVLTDQHWVEHDTTMVFDGHEIPVDENMLDAIELYVNTILTDAENEFVWHGNIKVEERFSLPDIDSEAFGTCDAAFFTGTGGVLYVYDFKYGAGIPVDVVYNKQLMYYALGALNAFKGVPNYVELVIIQPRAKHDDGAVRRHRMNIGKLYGFMHSLREAVQKTRLPLTSSGMLNAGDWCRFCAAKPICPAIKDMAKTTALAQFGLDIETGTPPAPEKLTVEQLSDVMKQAKIIQQWVDSVFEFAYAAACNGIKIPGMKLVKKDAHRKWKDETEVAEQYADELGEDLYTQKIKSPAQLEKLLGKNRLEELIPFWEKPDKGVTLVPEYDKRPEVLIEDAKDAFAEFLTE